MMEVGPWRTDGKGGFQVQEGGWEEYTTMVFGPPSILLFKRITHVLMQSTSLQAQGSLTRAQSATSIPWTR